AEVIVKYLTDTESAAIALIENIQRENLSAIEEARAYQKLLKMDGITQKNLAQNLGKSQSCIANKLRLLKLSDEVMKHCSARIFQNVTREASSVWMMNHRRKYSQISKAGI